MVRSGIQLYSLRNVEGSFVDLLERVDDAGFRGVEYAYRVTDADESTEEIAAALDELGLSSAGAHVPIDALEEDTEDTVEFFRALGCDDLVVPWLDEEHFASREAVEETAARLETLADDLADYGVDLHYHNHDQEFTDLGDTTGFEYFLEASDDRVGIEIDAGLALYAGADPVDLLERAGNRARLFHLKDVDLETGETVPAGRGDLDVEACAETLRAVGGEWLIYEYEQEDVLESLEEAGDLLSRLV